MKILVINEPFIKDFCRTQRWAARTRARVLRPPEWLAYATAVLEESGEDVELYDFPANNWGKKKLRQLIRQKEPDVVVVDSTTPSIYSDIECATICKEECATKVIMVGPHASVFPEETLKEAKGSIDVIAIGEYDYTVRDIVKNLDRLDDVLGIAYLKEDGLIKRTPPRPLIENLDELPFPAWRHLDLMKYYTGMRLYPLMHIIGGRGCPFRCIFCLWPEVMHGHKYRFRSPENIVDEMEYDLKLLPQLKWGEIFFEDDTFTVNKKHAVEVCEEILRRNLKITWSINARVDFYDLEVFKLMKKAGCRVLWVGIESGNQQMLNRMRKNITLEQIKEFVSVAKQAGLKPHGCFVLGLPGETRKTIEETIKFALDLDLPSLQFSAAVPFPGTEYYNICSREGLIRAKSWNDWLRDGEQGSVVEYPGLTREEIDQAVDRALKKFYFRPGYMLSFLLQTKNHYDLYRKLKGAKNFLSYLITKS